MRAVPRLEGYGADSHRSTVEAYARHSPVNSKWTKHTVAEHVSLGGNGPLFVGTPSQVADSLEVWLTEADVDGFNLVSDIPYMRYYLHLCLLLDRAMSSSRNPLRILRNCWCRSCGKGTSSGRTTRFRAARTGRTSTRGRVRGTRPRTTRLPSIGGLLVLLRVSMSSRSRFTGRIIPSIRDSY